MPAVDREKTSAAYQNRRGPALSAVQRVVPNIPALALALGKANKWGSLDVHGRVEERIGQLLCVGLTWSVLYGFL